MEIRCSLWLPFVLIFSFSQLPAQPITFQKTYGGAGNEVGNHIIATGDGYLIAGQASSPGNGSLDACLLRVDANGNVVWQKIFGGNQADAFTLVTEANDGGFLAMGETQSQGAGGKDIFIVKIDPNGSLQWSKTFGSVKEEISPIQANIVRLSNGYFIAGYQASIGSSSTISYFVRLSNTGQVIWTHTYTGASNFMVGNYTVADTIYAGGAINNDGCLAKIDANTGEILFLCTFSKAFNDALYNVRPTQDGNFLLSDATWSATNGTEQRQWLLKTRPDGTPLWSKTYGKTGINLRGVANNTTDGGFILSPYTSGFNAASDANLVKVDADGAILWAYSYGGPSDDQLLHAIQTNDGGFIGVGSTYHAGSGEEDILLVKTDANGLIQGCTNQMLGLSVLDFPATPEKRNLTPGAFVTGVNWNPATQAGLLPSADHCSLPVTDTLSGVVNDYTPVTGFYCDSSVLQVGQAAAFSPGDEVLIVQMQGAVINLNNTPDFGTVSDFGSAGHYEFNRIQVINGNDIQLKFALTKSYDVAGKVQLIRVPEYVDAAAGNLTCPPWDGLTGGVLAIDVANTFTLNGNLDVRAKGFRGGKYINDVNTAYHETQFSYAPAPNLGAAKGEGVAIIPVEQSYGRGRAANGGGGGNAANAGGGGGANAGQGGHGGEEYYNLPSSPTPGTQGLGGNPAFENNLDRIIMGGGGGAGHSNDFQGSSGGYGGGIIILKAKTLETNNHTLQASGEDVFGPGGTGANDGQGGGGAGGTILLDVKTVNGSLLCAARGGRGGDCLFYVTSQIIGPGGGGSGGKILIPQVLPSLLFDVDGGIHGIANQNLFSKSQNGEVGKILTGLTLPAGYLLPAVELAILQPICGERGQITVLNNPASLFSLNNGPFQTNPTFNNLEPGQYLITVQDNLNGCVKDSTVVLVPQSTIVGTFTEISLCPNHTISIGGVTYTQPGTVVLTIPSTSGGCDTLATYEIVGIEHILLENTLFFCPGESIAVNGLNYTEPAILSDTVFAQTGCDTVYTTRLEYAELPQVERDVVLCAGKFIEINGVEYGQTAVVTDTIGNPGGCDTLRVTNIRLDDTTASFLPGDTVLCAGDVLRILSPFQQTSWNGVLTGPVFEVDAPGVIVAFALNKNNCFQSDTIHIETCCSEKSIYVPNIFSPNDDQENDKFCVYPIERCGEYALRIYDRWGELLFESHETGVCWDGSFRGKPAAAGVYIWTMAFYSDDIRQQKILSGDITLVR